MRRWKRFLLFKFRMNLFEMPFNGQRDLIEPLEKWGISKNSKTKTPQLFISKEVAAKVASHYSQELSSEFIALAPSAAFALKRWPLENFKSLIQQNSETQFVLLGGPEDSFLEELRAEAPQRVVNFAGKLTLAESAMVISKARALVANDTGLLHVGEQLGIPTVALMGPAPFGFPSRTPQTVILEKDLKCRPCSKHGQGPCVNSDFQACLKNITAQEVSQALKQLGAL
jgi:ADP-heptose:LPS heptosyltransferase